MTYRIVLAVLASTLALMQAGFAQARLELLTPDAELNGKLAGKPIFELDLLVYAEGPEGLTIDPVLPPDWRWLAGKGFTSTGERVEFIVWEGARLRQQLGSLRVPQPPTYR